MMRAQTTELFGTVLRWEHVAVWMIVVALVGFVLFQLWSGRLWLAWVTCGVHTLSLILNFVFTPNLNYREITGLHHIHLLGESVSIAEGVPNPWMLVGQASFLLLLAFVVDATVTVWRRGEHLRALTLGSGIVFFVVAGSLQAASSLWGFIHAPMTPSLFFLGVLGAMVYELSIDMRRAAQLAADLRESEERMTLAAEAAGLGIWVLAIKGNEFWGSESWRRLFSFASDEPMTYPKVIRRIHPQDREMVERQIMHTVQEGGNYRVEYRVLLPDGAQRWLASRGRLYPDAKGKPARLLGATIDTTERKLAEAALKVSEERFHQVAEAAGEFIWEINAEGLLTYTSPSVEKSLGYKPDELVGRKYFYDLFAPPVREELKASALRVFGARQSFRDFSHTNLSKSGKVVHLEASGSPILDSEGNFTGYRGVASDVTASKQAEEKFRLAVESSPHGSVLINEQGKITLVNAQTEQLFGYTRQELVGQTMETLVPRRWRPQQQGHGGEASLEQGARLMGEQQELFGRRKDGTEFPIEIGLNLIESSEGKLVLAAIIDISARRRAETQALLHRNELAHVARVNTMGQLASSLAHELNQPLGAIMRNAEAAELLLQDPSPDLDEVRAILSDICKDDLRAGVVIDRMRGFLKRGEVQRQRLDLKALLADVVALVRPDADIHRVQVGVEAVPLLPPIQGDPVQLQQVMVNLLLNAMDALMAKPVGSRLVTVQARIVSEMVEVVVTDNGPGIPPDKLRQIFEPFFTSKPKGLGMGLAISLGIIEAHGGRLWAENNAGGGAVFRFTLPASVAGGSNQ